MNLRYAYHPENVRTMDTEQLRSAFLVTNLFAPGRVVSEYSLEDRMIVVGAVPIDPLPLEVDLRLVGADFFLERRELGIINLGGSGTVVAEGHRYSLAKTDLLYVSRGTREIVVESDDAEDPARFLCLSGPAHATFPTTMATSEEANMVALGDSDSCNERTLYQYVHPGGIQSANLVMGFTLVPTGSVWNTMPAHIHSRRMELYCYFDIDPEHRIFHFMGEPTQTRHIVVTEGDAVLSPSWSIHSGVGTASYSFVWAMLGDNQSFGDMDKLTIGELR